MTKIPSSLSQTPNPTITTPTSAPCRIRPEPQATLGDKFENAAFYGLDSALGALARSGFAAPTIHNGVKLLQKAGFASGHAPEWYDSIANSASKLFEAEYRRRPNRPSFEDLSAKHIFNMRTGSEMGKELKANDAFHDASFVSELENISHAKFSDGNKVSFLIDGPQAFEKRFELIDQAKESIYLLVWYIYPDATGKEISRRIAAKASEGVDVKIIVDGKIAMRSSGKETLKVMEEAGAKIIRLTDPEDESIGNHAKLLIVDNKAAVAGGMNTGNFYSHAHKVDSNYKGEKWRDTDILVEGPAVVDSLALFADYWNGQVFAHNYDLPPVSGNRNELLAKVGTPGKSKTSIVSHVPKGGQHYVYNSLMKAVEGATKSIEIENAYFLTLPGMEQLLEAALMRGVKVRIFTNSNLTVDEPLAAEPIMNSLPALAEVGAEIFIKKGDTLHSKFMVVDDSFASVGSFNLHPRSLHYDMEMAVNVIDPEAATCLRQTFDNDIRKEVAKPIKTMDDMKIESTWFNRFIERFFYDHL
ncbi:MAG: phosphatidylserine/phosphatidylglycerophosphate/cardiolipin synthase family protein [Myxococcota bacterium]|nr:phosphatidylserine/phosphatidylglycerophosphate/cardiolipin synthase family protein [Myxococcota bacterium]